MHVKVAPGMASDASYSGEVIEYSRLDTVGTVTRECRQWGGVDHYRINELYKIIVHYSQSHTVE
jgi:hypothetical protein